MHCTYISASSNSCVCNARPRNSTTHYHITSHHISHITSHPGLPDKVMKAFFLSRFSLLPAHTRPSTYRRTDAAPSAAPPCFLPTAACARWPRDPECPPCWRWPRAGTGSCSPWTSSAPWGVCGSSCDSRVSSRRCASRTRARGGGYPQAEGVCWLCGCLVAMGATVLSALRTKTKTPGNRH